MEKIDISKSEYRIVFDDKTGKHVLQRDGKPLLTPNKTVVSHSNLKLLQHMESELECRDELDVTELTTYSMYCTWNDFLVIQNVEFSKQQIRNWLISDSILRACAGPERVEQFYKWGALFEVLEEIEISYPDLVQSEDIEGVEEWIISNGKEYIESFDKFVDKMYEEFNLLSKEQKTAVLISLNCHGSFAYGLLLATKKCTELEYATAVLAGRCVLPWVFSNVSRSEYKEFFDQLISDANIITNFVRFSLEPNTDTIGYIKTHLPGYEFLPEAAKWSILEACRNILYPKSDDYSSFVVLLGKTLEVSLKTLVFDEFQARYNAMVWEKSEVKLFFEKNKDVQKLASYLVKHPHFIELGSMIFVLQRLGGSTAKKNVALADLTKFVFEELDLKRLSEKDFLKRAERLKDARNEAAHAKRFTFEEARELMDEAMSLVSSVV